MVEGASGSEQPRVGGALKEERVKVSEKVRVSEGGVERNGDGVRLEEGKIRVEEEAVVKRREEGLSREVDSALKGEELDIGSGSERVKNRQGIGKDGEVKIISSDKTSESEISGGVREEDKLVREEKRKSSVSDVVEGVEVVDASLIISEESGISGQGESAAVGTAKQVEVIESGKVFTNGVLRNVEMSGELGNGNFARFIKDI